MHGETKSGSRFFGIHISIHWSCFVLPIVALVVTYPDLFLSSFAVFVFGPALIFFSLLHELTKAIVAEAHGRKVSKIIIWPLGGLSVFGPVEQNATIELKIAIAGIFIHLPIIFTLSGIYYYLTKDDLYNFWIISDVFIDHSIEGFFIGFLQQLYKLNVLFIMHNLIIPAYPLDSCRITGTLLLLCGLKTSTAATITASVGIFTSLVLTWYGFHLFYFEERFGALFECILGLFLIYSSTNLLIRSARNKLSNDIIFGGPSYGKNMTHHIKTIQDIKLDVV